MGVRIWFTRVFDTLINIGAEDPTAADTRRIHVLNLTTIFGMLINAGFTLAFTLIAWADMRPIILNNIACNLGYITALTLSSRGSHELAMWAVTGTAFWNLVPAGLFFGRGAWLFIVWIPVLASLFFDRRDRRSLLLAALAGSLIFALVPLMGAQELPPPMRDTATGWLVRFFAAFSTSVFLSGLTYHHRVVAELAEEESEKLLLNILPSETARRLKSGESVIADSVPEVSVLFADLVDSTPLLEALSPKEVVAVLNDLFSAYDDICAAHDLEKIKTIGDAYMAVSGLPTYSPNHADLAAKAALALREELKHHAIKRFGPLRMRFGIHSGPVIAGVIGKRKFSYDVWGDTVNTASRMESTGEPGQIQVSQAFYSLAQHEYRFDRRGTIDVKGKAPMETYYLVGRIDRGI